MQTQSPTALQRAPRAPNECILRLRDVVSRTGRARSTLYSDIAAGEFPAPIQIGARAVGWLETEVTSWLQERIVASRRGMRLETKEPRPVAAGAALVNQLRKLEHTPDFAAAQEAPTSHSARGEKLRGVAP